MHSHNMEFVFWQNVLSIHQSSFLRNLSINYSVILVVEKETNPDRIKTGWSIPDMGKTSIIIAPSDDQIDEIIDKNREAIHVFSGIHAYELVRKAFSLTRKINVKTLILAEPYNFTGWKGVIRRYRKKIQFAKYQESIDGLLHTGELGQYWFKKAGFPEEKLFHWGYFTELSNEVEVKKIKREKPSILFVGSIDKRKNILELIAVAKRNTNLFDIFTIVGIGPLEKKLKNSIVSVENINYIGKLPNNQVKELMQIHDILILPSIFDGWGAVVNEALQNGMRVICSEHCGAYSLLDNKTRGEVFYFRKGDGLEIVLKRWLSKGLLMPEERAAIIEWGERSISGKVVVMYFIEICDFIFNSKNKRPIAPWLK